jgi:hypothetical protein
MNTQQRNDHHTGNALSEQPEAVQKAMLSQVTSLLATRASAETPRSPAGAAPRLSFDPSILKALDALVDIIAQAARLRGDASEPTDRGTTVERGNMRTDYVMGPGAIEYFPTWSFWGLTTVRMINTGSVPTVVTINDDRFHLNPGEQTDKDGRWAAFPIRVVNTIELPGSQVTVRVW